MSCERRRFALDASAVITFSKNGQSDLLEQTLATRAYVTDEIHLTGELPGASRHTSPDLEARG